MATVMKKRMQALILPISSVVDPEWFISDPIPDPDPTFLRVPDPIPDPDPDPDPTPDPDPYEFVV